MHRLLQLTLDLFDRSPAAPARPSVPAGASPCALAEPAPQGLPVPAGSGGLVPPVRATRPGRPVRPPSPVPPHGPPDGSPRSGLAPEAGSAPPSVEHRHPDARHSTVLGAVRVGYALRRARRRSIGLTVGAEGLVVSAPRWATLAEVERVLQDKARWVVRKLGEAQQRQQQLAAARIDWRAGVCLPFLGQGLRLVPDPTLARGAHRVEPAEPDAVPATLRLALPAEASPALLREATQAWLQHEARRLFGERLDHFAPRLGVRWRRLTLSSASTRWGSARNDGSIRLNWRLIHLPLALIDYVVVHELSHLRVMDHSPRFWAVVAEVLPEHAALRQQLQQVVLPPWA